MYGRSGREVQTVRPEYSRSVRRSVRQGVQQVYGRYVLVYGRVYGRYVLVYGQCTAGCTDGVQ